MKTAWEEAPQLMSPCSIARNYSAIQPYIKQKRQYDWLTDPTQTILNPPSADNRSFPMFLILSCKNHNTQFKQVLAVKDQVVQLSNIQFELQPTWKEP